MNASAASSRRPSATRPYRVAVLASGRGSNFSALLRAQQNASLPIELVAVLSDKPSAAVVERAREAGISTWAESAKGYASRADFDHALFSQLSAIQPDLIVCAGYMRIIGAEVLTPWTGRMINIHPSLLPKYPGLHTHRRALEAGDSEHGASVHFVTAELDGGPVIAQVRVPVLADDSEATLAARVLDREHPLLLATVAAMARGEIGLAKHAVEFKGQVLQRPLQLSQSNQWTR
ncbi:phosphoribosylglycinamide formyltransferase [Pseudomarimonas arenosa]|uniref:Phosphoribosylglycinamide formyltransferase n=1 Tax=Pseudomarimonas arenosa TaxID=2774145 RepID=A0AAW3ZTJ4_9GAMM|nr:phosphoribosylglycinamide formyltransferase [Pseudomarimonas arenosa]